MPETTTSQEEVFIDSAEDLRQLINRLRVASPEAIFLDTEADSLHSYREKLCLIQLNCADVLGLIDPLKIDEEALLEFMHFCGELDVWMHGADFDMTLFQRTFGYVPPRILDTQMAARLIGHTRFGLANLAESILGVSLSKSSQKADWGKRPLTEKMMRYAYDDVRYLPDLVDHLLTVLDEKERKDWFFEWCEWSRVAVLDRKERPEDEVWRVSGWGKLSRRELAFLRELWYWRDQISQKRDCPSFRIMNNQDLLKCVRQGIEGEKLTGNRALRGGDMENMRQAVERARQMPESDWPVKKRGRRGPREDVDMDVFDELRSHRDGIAEGLGLDPTILATRSALEAIAIERERASEWLMKWQKDLLFPDDE